jgi:hypothetical protein
LHNGQYKKSSLFSNHAGQLDEKGQSQLTVQVKSFLILITQKKHSHTAGEAETLSQ